MNYSWLLALPLVVACSGQNISERNLKKTLNHYFEEHPVCTGVQLNNGATIGDEKIRITQLNADGSNNKALLRQMAALDREGIYKRTEHNDQFVEYILDKNAARYFDSQNKLCIAHIKVNKVEWFSEPAPNAQGLTTTHAVYQGKFKMTQWAQDFFAENNQSDQWEEPLRASAVLIKTSDGWKHQNELPH